MIERFELAPDLSISRLVHGGWQFSAGHRLAGDVLDHAVEVLVESASLGVTTFDCADIYTGVEELYGRFLRRWKTTSAPTPIQILTKFVPDASALPDVDAAYVDRVVDRSLARLGVERLDLVQFYWWRDEVPGMEAAALRLCALRDAGKIRHVAVTNMDVVRLRRLLDAGVRVVSDQVQYSVLDRRPEHGLVEAGGVAGVHLLAFGALAGGFLARRWLGAADPAGVESRSQTKYRLVIEEFGGWDAYQALLSELASIADEHGVDVPAVAVRFVLQQPGVAAVICGATKPGQMARNADACAFVLDQDQIARIRRHTEAAPGPVGDVFELERDRTGPHGRIMKYDLSSARADGTPRA